MAQAPNPIRSLFQRAMVAQNNGKADLARELYGQVLKINPKLPEVHYQLGRLEMGINRPRQALRHLKTALKLKPNEPVIWSTMMDAHLLMKDQKAAKALLAASRKANLPFRAFQELENKLKTQNRAGVGQLGTIDKSAFEQAVARYQAGDFSGAETAAQNFLANAPDVAPALALLGASQAMQDKTDSARTAYEKALSVDPNYVEARVQFAQLLKRLNDNEEARKHLETALVKAPQSALVNRELGLLDFHERAYPNAASRLKITRAEHPDDIVVLATLSESLREVSQSREALEAIEHALTVTAPTADLLRIQGTVLAELERNDEAGRVLEQARALDPDNIAVLSALTVHHQLMGNFKETKVLAEQLFAQNHLNGDLFHRYVTGNKLTVDNPVVQQMTRAFAAHEEVDDTRASMAYALAKVSEDNADHAAAFAYLQEGNGILKSEFPPENKRVFNRAEQSREKFEQGLPTPPANLAKPSPQPIFICGMPRSGTTLVEQVVSSHSTVFAGGELEYLLHEFNDVLDLRVADGKPLSWPDLQRCRDNALTKYGAFAPGAPIITDKGISTFMYTGLLASALPGCKLIVVRRDPRDNCLSMYKNKFLEGTHRYTTDLETLGHAYLQYLKTLAYWRKALPGSFYEIRYEDLIANPEEKARELIAECGLDWEDGCLEFYKNARKVKTLSVYQVRQPIYSSSVGAWKHYEQELKPLIDILQDGGALEGW